MKLKSVKTAAELPIKGVEFTVVDGNITEVVLGGKVRIQKVDSYSSVLKVLVEARETATRWRIRAAKEGFADTVEYHEDYAKARERETWFDGLGAVTYREEVEVELAENGSVIGVVGETPATASVDIPF